MLSGFSEDRLDDLRGRLVGELDGGPMLVQRTLDIMDGTLDNTLPRPYDINQVIHNLAGFCCVCSACGYIVDAVLLDVDDICESCRCDDCPECGEFHCICDEGDDFYGFDDADFEDDDDFDDEMDDFEGDDWEDDWEDDD